MIPWVSVSIPTGLVISNHFCFWLRHAFQSLGAGSPNSELSLANFPASAFCHACHILYLSLGTIRAIKVKSRTLKWPTSPYTVCLFPPHPTFWPHFKLRFSPVPHPYWPPCWTQKVPPDARSLPELFPLPGILFLLVSTWWAHSRSPSRCLLLPYQEAFLTHWVQKDSQYWYFSPPHPSTLLHCSPQHLPVSKMQSLLVYHLMGSCNPPVLSRATLPAPCSLAPGAPFLLILTKHSCKAGFQASGSPRMSF